MEKKNKQDFNFRPHHLSDNYKNSYSEASQSDLPEFFKQLGKFMKKNPHLTLEDLRMSYTHYAPDFGAVYIFEGVWYDDGGEEE